MRALTALEDQNDATLFRDEPVGLETAHCLGVVPQAGSMARSVVT